MRILLWHVHGSWTTSFVQGPHDYLVPVVPGRGPDGAGRARTWSWPSTVVEVTPEQLRDADIDVVVLQRPGDAALVRQWCGREPGRDVPAVYLEHNTPKGEVPSTRHPMAEQTLVPLVHVTHFNSVIWDSGIAPQVVIEHGIVDPGDRYTGELARIGIVLNEPVRRGRVTGSDLIGRFSDVAPVDVFGMRLSGLHERYALEPERVVLHENPPQHVMHDELARRRVYVHPLRWTSLGLSLVEAMHLAMPVVVLATTEATQAVPPEAGCITTRLDVLTSAARLFVNDAQAARAAGKAARSAALQRYGLARFLHDWNAILEEVTR